MNILRKISVMAPVLGIICTICQPGLANTIDVKKNNLIMVSDNPLDTAPAIIKKVSETGLIAGAVSVCNIQYYNPLRFCTILTVLNWNKLYPSDTFDLTQQSQEKIENIWNVSADVGRQTQTKLNPPLSCEQLVAQVQRLDIWKPCQELTK